MKHDFEGKIKHNHPGFIATILEYKNSSFPESFSSVESKEKPLDLDLHFHREKKLLFQTRSRIISPRNLKKSHKNVFIRCCESTTIGIN